MGKVCVRILVLSICCVLGAACASQQSGARRVAGMELVRPHADDVLASRARASLLEVQRAQLHQDNPEAIIAQLNALIADYPGTALLYLERAKTRVRKQDWDNALLDAKQATVLDPKRLESHLYYAHLLTFRDRNEDAIATLEAIRAQHPNEELIYAALARLYLQLQRYDDVERSLRELLRHDPKNYTATFYLANLYDIYLKQSRRAERMYRRAMQLEPDNPQAFTSYAELLLDQERLQDSLDVFLQVESHYVDDAAVQLRIAVLYYELGDFKAAIRRITAILNLQPQQHKLRYYLGVIQQESGDMPQAVVAYRKIPPSSEYYKDAQLRLTSQLHQSGATQAAILRLQKALKHNPRVPEFYEYLVYLQQAVQQDEAARKSLQRAVKYFPEHVGFLQSLAFAYEQAGQPRQAVRAMLQILEHEPRNVTALNYVGYMYAEWGKNLAEAETMLQTALSLQPEDGHIADSLAWLYFQQRRFTEALTYAQQAHVVLPGNALIMRHYAQILLALQRGTEAMPLLEQARELILTTSEPDAAELKLLDRLLRELQVS